MPLYQYFADVLSDHRPPTTDHESTTAYATHATRHTPRDTNSTTDEGRRTTDDEIGPSSIIAHRLALPRLTVNLFSGGKHAGGQVPIQDVLLVPISARTIDESLGTLFERDQSQQRGLR